MFSQTFGLTTLGLNSMLISGILPMAIHCYEQGIKYMLVAPDNLQEALLVEGIHVYAPRTLAQLVSHLQSTTMLPAENKQEFNHLFPGNSEDFAVV